MGRWRSRVWDSSDAVPIEATCDPPRLPACAGVTRVTELAGASSVRVLAGNLAPVVTAQGGLNHPAPLFVGDLPADAQELRSRGRPSTHVGILSGTAFTQQVREVVLVGPSSVLT